MSGAPGVIHRVIRLELTDFRGFKARRGPAGGRAAHGIDTDADLVLIAGPNGTGKSSLLEALALLLTGWYGSGDGLAGRRDPVRDLIALDEYGCRAPGCRLAARVRRGAPERGEEEGIELAWTEDHQGELPMPRGVSSRLARPDPAAPDREPPLEARELDARLCAFFQDRIDTLFDEAVRGRTLRDLFEPVPSAVRDLQNALPKAREDLDNELNRPGYSDEWQGPPEADVGPRLAAAWEGLRPALCLLLLGVDGAWPEDLGLPPEVDGAAAMDGLAGRLAAALGAPGKPTGRDLRNGLVRRIEVELDGQVKRALRSAQDAGAETAALRRELEQVDAGLKAIEKSHPTLDQDLAAFAPGEDGLPDALGVFRALARSAGAWSRVAIPAREGRAAPLGRVLEELAAVEEREAGKCAEALGAWLEERRAAAAERERLRDRRAELEWAIDRSLASARLEDLRALKPVLGRGLRELDEAWADAQNHARFLALREARERAQAYLAAAAHAARWCLKVLEHYTAPDPELMEDLRRRADAVLWRFSLVEGVRPLRLEADEDTGPDPEQVRRIYRVRTADGRELTHLSTGQRAQVAVSLLVGQSQAVTHLQAHRVLLLDDVTTAYDLSNLTREAVLWRQLAYGADSGGDGTGDQRRQVFLSSHHEDMTNHLLDLLVPPAGRSLRLLRFTGWSARTGPEWELFDVTASRASGCPGRRPPGWDDLKQDLDDF